MVRWMHIKCLYINGIGWALQETAFILKYMPFLVVVQMDDTVYMVFKFYLTFSFCGFHRQTGTMLMRSGALVVMDETSQGYDSIWLQKLLPQYSSRCKYVFRAFSSGQPLLDYNVQYISYISTPHHQQNTFTVPIIMYSKPILPYLLYQHLRRPSKILGKSFLLWDTKFQLFRLVSYKCRIHFLDYFILLTTTQMDNFEKYCKDR